MKRILLSFPVAQVRPNQLRDELQSSGIESVALSFQGLDNGQYFLTFTVPDHVTPQQIIDYVANNHTPRADYGAPAAWPDDAAIDAMTALQVRTFIRDWTAADRAKINAHRAAMIAEGLANGWA